MKWGILILVAIMTWIAGALCRSMWRAWGVAIDEDDSLAKRVAVLGTAWSGLMTLLGFLMFILMMQY